MEEVWKGFPPTRREWKLKAWRRWSSLTYLATVLYTDRSARRRISEGDTATMSENFKNGRSARSVYPFLKTFLAYSKKRW